MTSGKIIIVGLGPGPDRWLTPEASHALEEATDIIGYIPYVERLPDRQGQVKHATDNRVEIDRARHALDLAQQGHLVAVVSGGDPGVFAMAAAVFEAIDSGTDADRATKVQVLPGKEQVGYPGAGGYERPECVAVVFRDPIHTTI